MTVAAETPGLLQRVPLRVKLVAALVALVAVGLVATGAVVTTSIRGYLLDQVDQDLVELSSRPPRLDEFQRGGERGPFRSRDQYARIVTPQGDIDQQQSVGTDESPPELTVPMIAAAGGAPFTVGSQDSSSEWRVVVGTGAVRILETGERRPAFFVRAIPLTDVRDTTRALVLAELLVGAVVLILLGGLAYVVVRTSLRPLGEVEQTAGEIAAGDLSRRVPEGHERTEVGRLSRAFNTMVAQIEAAFRARETSEASARTSEDRMRRFVADASHELRTPLTSIRGFAELYRQGAVTEPGEVARLMRRVEDEAARMGLLVEDLLLLARLDQQRPLQQVPVDLLDIARDAVDDARVLAPDRTIDLAVGGGEAPVVLGDEPRLRQVVTNLVANALTHTPAGTPVAVSLDTAVGDGGPGATGTIGMVRVAVHDRGPGLSPDERAKVFERFYRSDPSRTRSAGGTGLGLSIVAALVAAHGGHVTVDSEPGRGSTFAVDLPLYAGAPLSTSTAPPAVPGAGG